VEDQVASNGAVVEYGGPSGVVLGYPRQVSHGFHAVMTLISGGLWAFVWFALALRQREDRVRFDIDPWGNVWAAPITAV